MDGPRRFARYGVVMLLVAAPLTACGGEDGEGLLPTPTRTLTATPTRSITATPTRSPRPTETPTETPTESESPTETPSETPTDEPTPEPTETPTESPEPTEEPTETVTVTETPTPTPTEEPTPTPTPTPTESPSETPEAEVDDDVPEEDPAPAWVWWLLALVLLAAAVGIPLYLWGKRRRAWRTELAANEQELVWLARTHLPELRAKADRPDRVAGAWEVAGEGRAGATEDHLTALEASAPDDASAARARALRDAVRTARGRLATLDGETTPEGARATLDAAIAELEAVL